MTSDKKIGFKQRVPAVAFADCLREFMPELSIDSARVTEILAGYFSGDYARHRSMLHITACFNNPDIAQLLTENKAEIINALGNQQEAFSFCFALLCARYSFCYDIAAELAKLFRLQDVVSKELLSKHISNKYGFNENVKRTMERFLAFCEEAQIIKRPTKASYEMATIHKPTTETLIELWKKVYSQNEPLATNDDISELQFEPFFRYLKLL